MVARSSFVAVNAFEDISVKALYTTRLEGKSEGDYSSFNLGLHVEDDPQAVLQNRLALEKHLSKNSLYYTEKNFNFVRVFFKKN